MSPDEKHGFLASLGSHLLGLCRSLGVYLAVHGLARWAVVRASPFTLKQENERTNMEKAYDVKDLLARLKGDGLELAENEAGLFYKHLKEWVQESAVLSETKIDDIVAPFVGQLDPIMLPLIDKIDGQQG